MNPDSQQELEELRDMVSNLENKLNTLQNSVNNLIDDQFEMTRFLKPEQKQEFGVLMSEQVGDVFWNDVFYISSMNGPAAETTSSSELFSGSTREADTSSGKFLTYDTDSKFRCHFYFNGTDALDATAYIGTVGTSTLDSGISSINQSDMEYVALKVYNGNVFITAKSSDGTTELETEKRIIDDTTYKLEIKYVPNEYAEFFFDDESIGAITQNLPKGENAITFFPLMVSIQRSSGTDRKVTVESWEFLQTRKN